MGDCPVSRSLPTQDIKTQKNADIFIHYPNNKSEIPATCT